MNIQGKSNHQGILFLLVSFFPFSDINKEESNSCVQPVHLARGSVNFVILTIN